MKLLALVLVLSCVVAYTTARKRGQHWPTNTKIFTTPYRFRREADPQGSIVANLKNTPQLPFDDNENLRLVLFDNDSTVDLGEDGKEIPGPQSQPNTLSNNLHLIDENDYFSSYTFQPGTYRSFPRNFETGGRYRWRREAGGHVEPRLRFDAETQRGNSFFTDFADLQRRANGHGVEPTIGATAGIRFRREADQINPLAVRREKRSWLSKKVKKLVNKKNYTRLEKLAKKKLFNE
ncbi:uncharacterized protein LOC112463023 [Temnothorax curvispinosus]|uniref:Uncharacterized protein LOC112463023 n=1 Tax=Temnothorax curvispinosus TaxID=300111 RepID=A0A6J1QSR2_9HYME|nr:uncharacterized protein LOC112463023 [Temnothorax curvispinosus]